MDSNLLFSRGNTSTDDNENVWDDTALIRAYDKAVNKIKTDLTKTSEKKSHKSEKNKKKDYSSVERKQVKEEKHHVIKWKLGDKCIGIYSEDNVKYPAEIIDINNDDQTCRIRYDYYENEEDKTFDELLEPVEEIDVQKKEKKSSKQPKVDKQEKPEQKFQPLDFPIPPPPPPLPASLMSHFNNLTINEDESGNQVEDKEAFYSMLMSWYMSGYHTGYYFGLTQRQFSNQS